MTPSIMELLSNPLATIIAAILGGLLTYFFNRHKPTYVICTELPHSVQIFERGQFDKLPILYYGNDPVDQLVLVKLVFHLSGDNGIKDATIKITADGPSQLLGLTFPGNQERCHILSPDELPSSESNLTLKIDYLNSKKRHRDELLINIIYDGLPNKIDVQGGGPNWSARFRSLENLRNRQIRLDMLVLLLMTIPPILLLTSEKSVFSVQMGLIEILGYILIYEIVFVIIASSLGYRRQVAKEFVISSIGGVRNFIRDLMFYGQRRSGNRN